MIEELSLLGMEELTEAEQRAAVGGERSHTWFGTALGWVIGAFLLTGEALGEAAAEFTLGFQEGYSAARS